MQRRHPESRIPLTALMLIVVAVATTGARSQATDWQIHNAAGMEAYRAGRYAEAEQHFVAALKAVEEFDALDTRIAVSLNNLASLYRLQGKYDQAEPLYRRSLAIRERALGPNHLDVAVSLNNLAELNRTQRKYDQAEPLYRRSLTIREKTLGPNHPDVATCLENFATMLKAVKRDAEAEPLLRRAAQIRAQRR